MAMIEAMLKRFEDWKPPHFFTYIGAVVGGLGGFGFAVDYDVVNFGPNMFQSPEEFLVRGAESLLALGGFAIIGSLAGGKGGSLLDQAAENPGV